MRTLYSGLVRVYISVSAVVCLLLLFTQAFSQINPWLLASATTFTGLTLFTYWVYLIQKSSAVLMLHLSMLALILLKLLASTHTTFEAMSVLALINGLSCLGGLCITEIKTPEYVK